MNLTQAINIAIEAHKTQKDKVGKPYITHVLRVMERCKTEEEKMVAALHDVVEDTSITIDALRTKGVSEKVLAAVTAITHNKGESKAHYIARVRKNPLAIRVKLNDLEDNMDIRRLPKISDSDVERLRKYLRIYKLLLKDISK